MPDCRILVILYEGSQGRRLWLGDLRLSSDKDALNAADDPAAEEDAGGAGEDHPTPDPEAGRRVGGRSEEQGRRLRGSGGEPPCRRPF